MQVREIVQHVDWPCKVRTRFKEENLGCRLNVSEAITWFFEQEEEGIILEDDCLPLADLFEYASELLQKYRFDERIGVICGTALGDLRADKVATDNTDVVFSRYPSVWGWASWRRVWKRYDVHMASWPNLREDIVGGFCNSRLAKISSSLLQRTFDGKIDTWDYQLSFLLWSQSQLAVIPRINLVENIGFGAQATHTRSKDHPLAQLSRASTERLHFPLTVPENICSSIRYERYIESIAIPGIKLRLNRLLRGK
jgi:hypothetical protein